MAFLRFTRDKRGYEQFSLVEATTNRRGKSRSRLLYWYRTPPNVRVGREPFDEAVRRALEAQNPGVQFDWRKIIETPVPSAETEHWRERRRAEKAEKAARRAETAAAAGASQSEDAEEELEEELIAAPDVEAEEEREAAANLDTVEESDIDASAEATGDSDRAAQTVSQNTSQAHGARRRRRRRGRRGRSGPPSSTSPASSESSAPDSAMNHDGEPRISEPEGD